MNDIPTTRFIDDVCVAIDHGDYPGSFHYHKQLDGLGVLIHDADCADHALISTHLTANEFGGSTEYGPRHPKRHLSPLWWHDRLLYIGPA